MSIVMTMRSNKKYTMYARPKRRGRVEQDSPVSGCSEASTVSAGHPRSDTLSSESSHKLQSSATHREVADKVPEQGSQLKHRRDERQQG